MAIPAIIMGVVSLGSSLAQMAMAPGSSDYAKAQQDALNKQRIADAATQQRQKAAAIAGTTPDAIEASGGSLTAPGFMNLASLMAGVPADPLSQSTAFGQVFGANAPGMDELPSFGAGSRSAIPSNPLAPSAGTGEGGGGGGGDMMSKIVSKFLSPGGSDMLGAEFSGSFA